LVLNATLNNISVMSWRSVLLVEETGENHRPATSDWQTLSHNVVSSTSPWAWFKLTRLVVIGTDCIGSCKFLLIFRYSPIIFNYIVWRSSWISNWHIKLFWRTIQGTSFAMVHLFQWWHSSWISDDHKTLKLDKELTMHVQFQFT
jgi:hypothetical protein